MIKTILYFSVFQFFSTFCLSQDVEQYVTDCNSETLFSNGICLKNLNINLPWFINLTELRKYGNPNVDSSAKNGGTILHWDSVEVLNYFPSKIGIFINKKDLYKNVVGKVREFYIVIDTVFFQKIIENFEEYTSCRNCFFKTKTHYSWEIDGCIVRLMLKNNRKINFLADQHTFFIIIKKL